MPTRGLFARNIPIRMTPSERANDIVVEDSGGGGMRSQTVPGSTTANWSSAIGTSGYNGADLVNITFYRACALAGLSIDTTNLNSGAMITVRLFKKINGTEVRIYNQVFTRGNDTEGLEVVNGRVMFNGYLRCEILSSSASDDGKAIGYEYALEY